MGQEIVAKRYANAIFQIAREKQLIETFEEELRTLKEVVSYNKELTMFLGLPNIEMEKKKQFIQEAFSSFSQEILNLLYMLIDRHREALIIEIVDTYIEYANEERNIADATVYSVRELTEDERYTVAETFSKVCKKDAIRVHNIVDDNLLGGIKVRIGNRIYDGSLQGKIARIRRDMLLRKA